MTYGIVLLALFRIRQHTVCLTRFLELRFGFFVARMKVGMILLSKVTISFFYLIVRRRLAHSQHFVIISFLFIRHISQSPQRSSRSL